MGRRIVALFCCFLIIAALVAPTALADNSGEIVYVTNTGSKYHRDGCGYLRSKNEKTLREAVERGYTPCSRCSPPRPDFEYVPIAQQRASSGTTSGSRSSGSSSSSRSSESSTRTRASAAPEKESDKDDKSTIWGWFFLLLFGAPLAVEGIGSLYMWISAAKDRREEKERYILLYSGRTPEQLIPIPRGQWIGSDGLPRSEGSGRWGSVFTFFVSSSGKAYHDRWCRYSGRIEVNAYNLRYSGKTPCKVCKPTLPDMAWVDEYKKIKTIKQRYKID